MSIRIIDTHCHLDMEEFDKDREEVVERSKKHGVEAVIIPATKDEEFENNLELSRKHRGFLYYMVGVHPHEAKTCTQNSYIKARQHLKNPECVGIGEIGLDYHYNFSPQETQKEVFSNFLRLSLEENMPVSIHCREATEDTIAILKNHRGISGVIHCFSGEKELLKAALDLGLNLGIGGIITFKNSQLKETIRYVPLESIVLETDAPYLAPVPKRGKRNEPIYIHYVIDALSELLGKQKEEIAEIAYKNSKRLFFHKLNQ